MREEGKSHSIGPEGTPQDRLDSPSLFEKSLGILNPKDTDAC